MEKIPPTYKTVVISTVQLIDGGGVTVNSSDDPVFVL